MAPQLPCELEEDILSRLPPQSLVRFRSVCKQWNSLFKDKNFLNKYHLSHSRPQFIIVTANSKIYSIDIIDLDIKSIYSTIELRELPSFDIPFDNTTYNDPNITTCDEVLFYNFDFWRNKTALCNPWLGQVRYIEPKWNPYFHVVGIGYDYSRPEKVYKILGYYPRLCTGVVIYDCASNALKFINTPDQNCTMTVSDRQSNVSLNGNLYWITRNRKTLEYFIQSFDFLTENFKPFCLLPCQKNNTDDQLIIAVYNGDRFSLLTQCYETKKIEIWVMEKKIDREEEEVVWINLMTLLATTLPRLSWKFDYISYFIYDKTLFMCCSKRHTGGACIYIVRKDMCKEIQIDHGLINCCYCVYTPNLISIPLL